LKSGDENGHQIPHVSSAEPSLIERAACAEEAHGESIAMIGLAVAPVSFVEITGKRSYFSG
jgi:hypothetical protein